MTDTYSNRSNARRAANAMIAKGTAPAAKYRLTAVSSADGGGIRIVWQIEETEPAPRPQPQPAPQPQGVMPEKPVIASKANPGYQKRFDYLAERAAAGDWKAVAAYEVKGVNTYAKMVIRYRDRLLAAHNAQEANGQ